LIDDGKVCIKYDRGEGIIWNERIGPVLKYSINTNDRLEYMFFEQSYGFSSGRSYSHGATL